MTNIVSSRSIGHVVPAAGRPASQPPPSLRANGGRLPPSVRPPPPSVRPPPASVRPPPLSTRAQEEDFDDDGAHTAVRGALRIVNRSTGRALSNGHGRLAPASVVKATLESARGNRRDGLLAGTPSDLRDESDDRLGLTQSAHAQPERVPFARTAQPLSIEPAPVSVTPPTGYGPPSSHPGYPGQASPSPSYRPAGYAASSGPMGMPTAPYAHGLHSPAPAPAPASNVALAHAGHANANAPASQPPRQGMGAPSSRGAYQQAPFTPRSSPPASPSSAPAHFMTPQSRYADPPGTVVTAGHRASSGRPATSWAVALLACGLFVGVAAVAVTQGSEAAADTTASFVDPSHTASVPAAQPPSVAKSVGASVSPAAAAAPQGGIIGASPVQDRAAVPGVFGSAPVAPVAAAPAAAAPGSASIASGGVVGGFAPVSVAPTAPTAPAARSEAREAKPRSSWHPAPRLSPAARVAASEEAKEAKEASKKKPAAPDDETKKALEALQKAQLESSNSFGN